MTWVGQFFSSSDELFNGGLEGYFTLSVGTGGSTPTQVTANTSTQVNFTAPNFIGRIMFFGENLTVGSVTLPNGTALPILATGTVTRIEFLYNFRLADAISAGVSAPELMQAAFLEPSANIDVPSISASGMTNAIVQSYNVGTVQPFTSYLSQFSADFRGTNGVNLINGFNGNDTLRGFDGNDALAGNGGDDLLDGGPGTDVMAGGEGSDYYLPGPPGVGTPTGDSVSDSGTNPNDIDTISYENATGPVVVDLFFQDGDQSAGWAKGLIAGGIERVIGSRFNDTLIGTDFPESITDTAADILIGGDGDDTLVGLGGSDTLQGSRGFDTLIGGQNGDIANSGPGDRARFSAHSSELDVFYNNDGSVLVAAPGGGVDQLIEMEFIETSNGLFNIGSFTPSARQLLIGDGKDNALSGDGRQSLIYGRDGNDTLKGGGGNDYIEGGNGNDTLDGESGADEMRGEIGDDTYFVDNVADVIVEFASEGVDTVRTSVTFDLLEGVVIEVFETTNENSTAQINLYGNTLAQTITGNAGANFISDGGRGDSDTLRGLGGNDTYRVYNTGTRIFEAANGGSNDTVLAAVSFDLLEDVHVETLATTNSKGTAKINLYGNTLAQTITGNAGANFISDGGKGGSDTLRGLGGNDTYRVYNTGTKIVESKSGGSNDTVLAAVTFDLVGGVHVETLATTNAKSTAKINLYGNEIAQKITGNAGNNIISDGGKGGADTLVGLGGHDTYRVYNSGTKIIEGPAAGSDTVEAAVNYTVGKGVYIQVLETTNAKGTSPISLFSNEFGQTINGNAGDNALRGYGGNDTINGGPGEDRISGGPGNDIVAGNTGADTYYFSYALNAATNVDTIKGFSSIDLISLSSSIFTKAGPAGALAASAFRANTTGQAGDASDRIIWESDTGRLYYDSDGTGAAARVLFAVVTGNTGPMNAGDFVIA